MPRSHHSATAVNAGAAAPAKTGGLRTCRGGAADAGEKWPFCTIGCGGAGTTSVLSA